MDLLKPIVIRDGAGYSKEFKTFENIKSFLSVECKFWKKMKDTYPNAIGGNYPYIDAAIYFNNALSQLKNIEDSFGSWDEPTKQTQISSWISRYIGDPSGRWLSSTHPFIRPWLESYKHSRETGDGFINAILQNGSSNITRSFTSLQGYILAYEYKFQDESLIRRRGLSEKASFSTIRAQLEETKETLIDSVAQFQHNIDTWKDDTTSNVEGWHNEQRSLYEETAIKHSKGFQERLASWTEQITALENTYKEKLRFKGPAEYWANRARNLKEQGLYWVGSLILLAAVAIVYFGNFFIAWLQGQPIALQLQTLEGALLFAAILSTFAVMFRTLSRLTFSAFHLQRDAEEREQLTHLYLALSNETQVDDESRKIVLQALFSRSESGLLNNEHGPTMPTLQDAISVIPKRS